MAKADLHLNLIRLLAEQGLPVFELSQIAVIEHPNSAEAWRHCGDGWRASSGVTEAIECYLRARQCSSADPDTLNDVGIAFAGFGMIEDAIDCFNHAIRRFPLFPQSHYNLGVALAQLGRRSEADASFRLAIQLKPDYAEAHLALGNSASSQGRSDEALEFYREAVRSNPVWAEALNALGLALINAKAPTLAVLILGQAVRLQPDFEGAMNNLGLALTDAGQLNGAKAAFHAALLMNAKSADAHSNLGNLYKEQGQLENAIACYDSAIAASASSVSARWNRALALLQSGNFEDGWREYEVRWLRSGPTTRQPASARRWDGSDLSGRSILVLCEQGLGDAIQFIRYCFLLKERGGVVIVKSPAPLMGIFSGCLAIDQLLCEGSLAPRTDFQVSLMSLPWIFGTRLDSIPADTPYLCIDDKLFSKWHDRLTAYPGFKVGLVWQGNPHHQWDLHRSAELSLFEPLSKVEGVQLFSLQRGPGTEQIPEAPFPVVELLSSDTSDSESIMDLAAIMKCLDLVVSVDTATCHLAGALDVKTWILLSTLVDWRWLLDRDDSPWYPSVRLFRQKCRDDWSPVILHVANELVASVCHQSSAT